MQLAIAITRRVQGAVPRPSQVIYASMQQRSINAAIAEDAAKASSSLKRKHFGTHSLLIALNSNSLRHLISFFLIISQWSLV